MMSLLKRFAATPAQPPEDARPPAKGAAAPVSHDAGWWHESSYDLLQGVQVTEWFWSDLDVDFVRANDR